MDCKATSTKSQRAAHRRRCHGGTLVEYLFAIGIGGLLLSTVAMFAMHHGKTVHALGNMVDMDQANRNAQSQMSTDFRQTRHLTSYTTTTLTFEDYDGAALVYRYSPQARTLVRQKNGRSTTLLEGVDNLTFGICQRNFKAGTFEYYPATSIDTCKVIQVNWMCSREMFGQKANLISSQSASIAIRKH
jgi:Tfp pilus assembly protein PilW